MKSSDHCRPKFKAWCYCNLFKVFFWICYIVFLCFWLNKLLFCYLCSMLFYNTSFWTNPFTIKNNNIITLKFYFQIYSICFFLKFLSQLTNWLPYLYMNIKKDVIGIWNKLPCHWNVFWNSINWMKYKLIFIFHKHTQI